MVTLFVRHKVEDFSAWKAAYDAFDEKRGKLGVIGHGAYHAEDDEHDVTVYHNFEDLDTAKSFAESTELQAAMADAGIVGVPISGLRTECELFSNPSAAKLARVVGFEGDELQALDFQPVVRDSKKKFRRWQIAGWSTSVYGSSSDLSNDLLVA